MRKSKSNLLSGRQVNPHLIVSRHFGPKINECEDNSHETQFSDSYVIYFSKLSSLEPNCILRIKATRIGNTYRVVSGAHTGPLKVFGGREIYNSEHETLEDAGRKLVVFLKEKKNILNIIYL